MTGNQLKFMRATGLSPLENPERFKEWKAQCIPAAAPVVYGQCVTHHAACDCREERAVKMDRALCVLGARIPKMVRNVLEELGLDPEEFSL